MKIAVLSGKGGTGKTFISTNLAYVIPSSTYVDCDVEEPNGTLFFKLDQSEFDSVSVKVPMVNDTLCNGCRACVDFCKFHALAFVANRPMLFSEVCHSCGGCSLVCPQHAIKEFDMNIGKIVRGNYQHVKVYSGELNIGEASGVPIIKQVLKKVQACQNDVVIDCPPGSACSVSESIADCDVCLFVVEATSFGLHNLQMIYELATIHKKPCGIVINKYVEDYEPLIDFCKQADIAILAKIPYDKALGNKIANGEIASEIDDSMAQLFRNLYQKVGELL